MKTLLSFFVSILFLTANSISVFAEEIEKDHSVPAKVTLPIQYNGLGVSAGAISGLGFSYREYLNDKIGYKISTVLYSDVDTSFINGGLQGIYVLSDNDWMRFYAIAGVADFNSKITRYVYESTPAPTTVDSTKNQDIKQVEPQKIPEVTNYICVGGGIGMEIGRNKRNLSLALELPLVALIKNFGKDFSKDLRIYPIPQISLIYNF